MGFFDLPAPLLGAVDSAMAFALPPVIRLLLWGVFAGWLTMVLYRRLSNQERISELKAEQKLRQQDISRFDGEFEELLPLIKATLKLGFRQLGLAIGPALLASIPVLFVVAWVAGQFGYEQPRPGDTVVLRVSPPGAELKVEAPSPVDNVDAAWHLPWPEGEAVATVSLGSNPVLVLPAEKAVPVIHKKQWWNLLFANPLGYLPDDSPAERIDIGLPPQQFLPFGPGWLRGWMFLFFFNFLVFSVVFKYTLKID